MRLDQRKAFDAEDGPQRGPLAALSAAMLGAGGSEGQAKTPAQDAANRKDLLQKRLQRQKMTQVGRLVVGVAHDFNNILAAIQGCAGMLEASSRLTQEDRADLADILQATQRGAELVRGLIDFSRADRPRENDSADLGEGLVRMDNLLQRLLPEGISLMTAPTDGAAKIRISPSKLDQIVLNLVVNARDAMPDGGRIELKASMSAGCARLSVSDTGVGMPPDVQARIGEPFFSTKAEGKGTGLGLATVSEIVADCGGRISVRSAPGAGTTFEILLPLVDQVSPR